MIIDTDKYVDLKTASEILGLQKPRISKLCITGRLKGAIKFGSAWLIPRESLTKYEPEKRGRKNKYANLLEQLERDGVDVNYTKEQFKKALFKIIKGEKNFTLPSQTQEADSHINETITPIVKS